MQNRTLTFINSPTPKYNGLQEQSLIRSILENSRRFQNVSNVFDFSKGKAPTSASKHMRTYTTTVTAITKK